MGKILSWGKNRLVTRKKGGTSWQEWNTPIQNTTTVNTTKGEKKEAKIEGGENEAVKYGKNTYQLQAGIRLGAKDKKPVADNDGVVDGEYEVAVIPENITAPGIYINSCCISLEDTFSTEEGIQLTYAFDALTADEGDQLKYGTFTITETTKGDISTASAFSFQEISVEGGEAPASKNLLGK